VIPTSDAGSYSTVLAGGGSIHTIGGSFPFMVNQSIPNTVNAQADTGVWRGVANSDFLTATTSLLGVLHVSASGSNATLTFQPLPEPGQGAMLVAGILGIALIGRRRIVR
jgi:hypothetical protein